MRTKLFRFASFVNKTIFDGLLYAIRAWTDLGFYIYTAVVKVVVSVIPNTMYVTNINLLLIFHYHNKTFIEY